MTNSINTRRHDLDWLRVIAFGLLIFYHVGMYYVTWGWHVKSPYESDFLEPAMMLLNPWRLSLLFVISGIAVRFAADKASAGSFAWSRLKRLTVPFFFGAFVIVAPQTYFELLRVGAIEPGYWDFYTGYVDLDQRWQVFTPTYNHLWYVLYVLIYTLLVIPLLPLMRGLKAGVRLQQLMQTPLVLVVPALLFVLYRFTTDVTWPETHDIRGDWGAHIRYFSYFVVGLLVAKSDAFWTGIAHQWKLSLGLAVVGGATLSLVWANWDMLDVDGVFMQLARAARIFYIWWVICALFGAAQRYLNHPSQTLSYLTEAVFPYYILHQTVIIVIGVAVAPYLLGAVPEFLLVTFGTIGACMLLHEYVIRRVGLLRPLFGLKPKAASPVGRPAMVKAQTI
ncbi:acyltransferase family protein [Kordiimonas lipolytica]|uniref:Acyltransferase family protein n=1 Tax=Kordiimonas lipolytica TaxID=1662421 RepID=A0ABV8UF71_9PROT|nr:acyltransferase family protein [Kordiimonas lipolytica]